MPNTRKIFESISCFLDDKVRKVLLIPGGVTADFSSSLAGFMQERSWPNIFIDMAEVIDVESDLGTLSLNVRGLIVFTNAGIENLYMKYKLERWQAKVIIIYDQRLLHPTLNCSLYFAPIKNGKIQKHLFSQIRLPHLLLVSKNVADTIEAVPKETLKVAINRSMHARNHFLNKKIMTSDSVMMQMLADRVQQDETFKAFLFTLVFSSRDDEHMQVAAANAITVLVYAKVSFAGMNFSGIRIAGAVLNDAILDHVDLSGADLTGVSLHRAYLGSAKLIGANLKNIDLGELPFLSHEEAVEAVACSIDGTKIFTANGKTIYVWSTTDYQLASKLSGHQQDIDSLALSPDNKYLASASFSEKIIRVWDVASGKLMHLIRHEAKYLKFSPDSKMLVACFGVPVLWDVVTGKSKMFLDLYVEKSLVCMDFSPNNKVLVCAGYEGKLIFWHLDTNKIIIRPGHQSLVLTVEFSQDGKYLASAGYDQDIHIWGTEEKVIVRTYKDPHNLKKGIIFKKDGMPEGWHHAPHGHISSVKFSSDGRWLFSSDWHGMIRVWNLETQQLQCSFMGHKSLINSLHFCAATNLLLSASGDKTVRFWPLLALTESQATLQERLIETRGVHINGNGNLIVTGHNDFTVRLWDLPTGKLLKVLRYHQHNVNAVRFSPDSYLIVSASVDATIRVYDLRVNKVIRTFWEKANDVEFSSDGKVLAAAYDNKVIKLFAIESGATLQVLDGYVNNPSTTRYNNEGWINKIAFSPNGKYLAATLGEGTIMIWDLVSNALIRVLKGHNGDVNDIKFTSDGLDLISASKDKTIKIWELSSGKLLKTIQENNSIKCIGISQNGMMLAYGEEASNNCSVKIFSLALGTTTAVFDGYTRGVSEVSFYNNNLIVTGDYEGGVKVWHCVDTQWLLLWSSHSSLYAKDCDIAEAIQLSAENYKLLEQCGAFLVLVDQTLIKEFSISSR